MYKLIIFQTYLTWPTVGVTKIVLANTWSAIKSPFGWSISITYRSIYKKKNGTCQSWYCLLRVTSPSSSVIIGTSTRVCSLPPWVLFQTAVLPTLSIQLLQILRGSLCQAFSLNFFFCNVSCDSAGEKWFWVMMLTSPRQRNIQSQYNFKIWKLKFY